MVEEVVVVGGAGQDGLDLPNGGPWWFRIYKFLYIQDQPGVDWINLDLDQHH